MEKETGIKIGRLGVNGLCKMSLMQEYIIHPIFDRANKINSDPSVARWLTFLTSQVVYLLSSLRGDHHLRRRHQRRHRRRHRRRRRRPFQSSYSTINTSSSYNLRSWYTSWCLRIDIFYWQVVRACGTILGVGESTESILRYISSCIRSSIS